MHGLGALDHPEHLRHVLYTVRAGTIESQRLYQAFNGITALWIVK